MHFHFHKDICAGAILYADLIHTKLAEKGYYDEEGQFDVTEEVNNSKVYGEK